MNVPAPSLATRLIIGVSILVLLAIVDLRAHGKQARRWREYLFLLFCVAAAMLYGAINDQVSSSISWEYFYYGKELSKSLGSRTPPDSMALHLAAAKVGAQATWSVGLLLGAALLIANNPRPNRPTLPYRAMIKLVGPILLMTIAFAAVFGVLGYFGLLNRIDSDFAEMWRTNYWRPRRFTAAWGEHLGSYLGGIIAGTWTFLRIRYLRRQRAILAASDQSPI